MKALFIGTKVNISLTGEKTKSVNLAKGNASQPVLLHLLYCSCVDKT